MTTKTIIMHSFINFTLKFECYLMHAHNTSGVVQHIELSLPLIFHFPIVQHLWSGPTRWLKSSTHLSFSYGLRPWPTTALIWWQMTTTWFWWEAIALYIWFLVSKLVSRLFSSIVIHHFTWDIRFWKNQRLVAATSEYKIQIPMAGGK